MAQCHKRAFVAHPSQGDSSTDSSAWTSSGKGLQGQEWSFGPLSSDLIPYEEMVDNNSDNFLGKRAELVQMEISKLCG